MPRLSFLLLLVIHGLYAIVRLVWSLAPARKPKPLRARRLRIPGHLAIIFVTDPENHDAREEEIVMEECVEQIVGWCQKIGVQRLTVYEPDGVLSRKSRFALPVSPTSTLDLLEKVASKLPGGMLTPPPSDTDSTSRSRSPDIDSISSSPTVVTVHIPYLSDDEQYENEKRPHRRKRQNPLFESRPLQKTLTLHVLSRESSKPAIAATARSLAELQNAGVNPNISTESLGRLLEGENAFPAPDLIIVHSLHPTKSPLELHGFPPWQARLSEIYYAPRRARIIRPQDPASMPLSEVEFRRALDDYSRAEMRLGR